MRQAALVLAAIVTLTLVAGPARAGTTWYVEEVPLFGNDYRYTTLAYDLQNFPHIALFDDTDNTLVYAVKKNAAWTVDTLDLEDGRIPSMVMTDTGLPHIAYWHRLTRLKYAFYTGFNWIIETIVDENIGDRLSLDMGPGNVPHVAYRDFPDNKLWWAVRGPGGWTSEEVDSSASGFDGVSIAVDSSGDPHIAYIERVPKRLLYAKRTAGVWSYEIIDSVGTPAVYPRGLALDQNDVPHVAFFEDSTRDLEYASRVGGTWAKEFAEVGVGGGVNLGKYASLVLAPDDTPHIAHERIDADDARYTTKSGMLWVSTDIYTTGNAGEDIQIAMAPDGNLGAAWVDPTAGEVWYANTAFTLDTPLGASSTLPVSAWPNPMRGGVARLAFSLSQSSNAHLAIYDAQGRVVRVLADRRFEPGRSELRWDGSDAVGSPVEAGIYFVRLTIDGVEAGAARIAVIR